MIQVTYFKATHGKRIFKMAPIHHHFELCGWSETRVVAVFHCDCNYVSDRSAGIVRHVRRKFIMDLKGKKVLVFRCRKKWIGSS